METTRGCRTDHSAASGWKEARLTGEVLDKFLELITTALGLVAALA
jgi:hypothetical protein